MNRTISRILLVPMLFAACTKDPIYLPDPEDAPSAAPLVTVIYDPGALGDMTYNDLIFEGVERAAVAHGLRTRQYAPRTKEEGLDFLSGLFAQMSNPADTVRQLLVIAGSSYDQFVRSNNRRLEANPRADLLYFETREPLEGKGSSVHIRFYGAMYMAGAVTPLLFSDEALVVAANPYDVSEAVAGFQAGFWSGFSEKYETEKNLFLEYLSDQPGGGFSIDDATALHIMYEQPWSHEGYSGTIIPICGGAGSVFRRLSENSSGFDVLGVDRVILSTACSYAAVKHSDRVAERCIAQWVSEEGLPKHQSFGLEESYTEMVFCPAEPEDRHVYEQNFPEEQVAALRKEAIEKEVQYENR